MSIPKTLILDIGKNSHTLQDGSEGSSSGSSDASAYIDEKLNDYVKIADIADNLTTDNANKPLSAAQGVELKSQIDLLKVDIAKIIVDGLGISGGDGVKVTVEDNLSVISADIDENSPLAFNSNGQLYLKWNENN